jgi:hypothetical protein
MKYLKTLGLVAVAAMAFMALAGSSTASATILCKTSASPCPEGWDYPAGTELHARIPKPAFIDEIVHEGEISDECPQQTIGGKTKNTGGATETVSLPIEQLSWAECPRAYTFLKRGSLEIHYASEANSTVTLKESEYTMIFVGFDCVYGSGSGVHFGTLTGGSEPTIHVVATIPRTAGNILACPPEIRWTADFEITTPTPLHVAAS